MGEFEPKETFKYQLTSAIEDIIRGLRLWWLWYYLPVSEIQSRYRRTFLGPFWATISMGVFIAMIGLIYSSLWQVDISHFLPYLASGYIIWILISTIINEGTMTFIQHEHIVRNTVVPFSVFPIICVVRNLMLFLHHFTVYLFVAVIFSVAPGWGSLLFFPALVLVCITGFWVVLVLGIVSARFRDIPHFISSIILILLLLTPILFEADSLRGKFSLLVDWNILYHYIEILRAPLLGKFASALSWIMVSAFTIFSALAGLTVYAKYRTSIIFWL